MSRRLSSPVVCDDAQVSLREAFAAIRLESALASRVPSESQDQERLHIETTSPTRRQESFLGECPMQISSDAQEEHATLAELWADPNTVYTMSCLEAQFTNIFGLDNPSKLTLRDFEQLYKASYRELNAAIIEDNLIFVDFMQNYDRGQLERDEQIRAARMYRLRQEVQESPMLDQNYPLSQAQVTYHSNARYSNPESFGKDPWSNSGPTSHRYSHMSKLQRISEPNPSIPGPQSPPIRPRNSSRSSHALYSSPAVDTGSGVTRSSYSDEVRKFDEHYYPPSSSKIFSRPAIDHRTMKGTRGRERRVPV